MSRKTSSALLQLVESKSGSSSESATVARMEIGDSTHSSAQLLTSVVASVRKVEEPFASPVNSPVLDVSSAGISPGPVDINPSQLDIHLSRVDLIQKFLYESITGEGMERRFQNIPLELTIVPSSDRRRVPIYLPDCLSKVRDALQVRHIPMPESSDSDVPPVDF
jgi:hypothetical protein